MWQSVLQRLGQFPRPLLFCLEQPRVLDRDDRLVSEGLDQLDLLLGERPDSSVVQNEQAKGIPSRRSGTPRIVR